MSLARCSTTYDRRLNRPDNVSTLAFQQLSELGGEGIDVLGPLPSEIQMITTFSGGVALSSTQPDAARALLAFFASPAHRGLKQAHGMDAP
jgi:molybdate transport system substrate-binding protein